MLRTLKPLLVICRGFYRKIVTRRIVRGRPHFHLSSLQQLSSWQQIFIAVIFLIPSQNTLIVTLVVNLWQKNLRLGISFPFFAYLRRHNEV